MRLESLKGLFPEKKKAYSRKVLNPISEVYTQLMLQRGLPNPPTAKLLEITLFIN